MNYKLILAFTICLALVSCNNSSRENKAAKEQAEKQPASEAVAAPEGESGEQAGNDIVGEWEQVYVCLDKNGNYKLEPEEKKPADTHLGFNWFRFNADGTCLRDKDLKFKGNYEIEEKNGKKKLVIKGGDVIRYTISDLTDKELVLGSDGAFMVFKRI